MYHQCVGERGGGGGGEGCKCGGGLKGRDDGAGAWGGQAGRVAFRGGAAGLSCDEECAAAGLACDPRCRVMTVTRRKAGAGRVKGGSCQPSMRAAV